jgi:Domain of unknown function (DUF4398)
MEPALSTPAHRPHVSLLEHSRSIEAQLTASSVGMRLGAVKMAWICGFTRRLRRESAILLALGSVIALAACASTPPPPTLELSSAKQAIAAADQTRVADASSPELSEARDKLTAAQTAVQDKHMVEAQRLAVESRVDAELASARIASSKEQAVNHEMIKSTDTLSQEMQRNSGAKP